MQSSLSNGRGCIRGAAAAQQHRVYSAATTAAAATAAVRAATHANGRTPRSQPSTVTSINGCRLCIGTVSMQHRRRGVCAAAAAGTAAAAEDAAESQKSPAEDNTSSSTTDLSVDEPAGFLQLGIDPLLVAGLAESGIEVPSPIQESAIPVLLSGQNAAVQSYTGSGKTLAYLLPALTLGLNRAEAAYRRRQAALAASKSSGKRVNLKEDDLWTVQVLVVAPSQELAMQISRVAQGLFPQDSRTAVQQAIGGANIRRQAEAIAEHQPIMVVGTPGRVVDLVGMGVLRLHRCPLLILDEADQLLGDVYARHINTLMQHCGKRLTGSSSSSSDESPTAGDQQQEQQQQQQPQQQDQALQPTARQTVLVSATLWAGGLKRFEPWCPNPTFITMGAGPTWSEDFTSQGSSSADEPAKTWGWGAKGWEGPASVVQAGPKTQGSVGGPEGQGLVPTLPPQLEHMYVVVNPDRKSDVLRRAVYALDLNMGLAFMNWQQRLKDMAARVAAKKIEVGSLHGELQPSERGATLEAARNGAFRLLLVSDLAARGLDLPQVDAVFNLELPSSAAHYAHRAGRTGRMGAPGLVMTFVAPGERFVVERLSKKLGVPIVECHLAGGKLVVGPPPKKDHKPKQTPEDRDQQSQQEAAGTVSSSSKQSQQKQKQLRDQPAEPQTAAAAAAAKAGKPAPEDGLTFDAEAAAFDLGEADSSLDDVIDESGVFLLDEADDVEVEGDEPLEQFQARLKKSIEQELAEIQEERKALRQSKQQQQRRDASADADADVAGSKRPSGDGSRRVRQKRVPVPGGSPQEAAALAVAAIEADEAAQKARKRLPAALLAAHSSGARRGGSGGGGGGRGGRKLRGNSRQPSK